MFTDANTENPAERYGVENEEMRQARLEIRALRAELAETANVIEDLKRQVLAARRQGERYRFQVEVLRRSSSWRLTRPLRIWQRRRTNAASK
ncbi:hypothetical protein E3O06_07030 [Cryobacterium glaciale]|uniref:Uncharacterized protein n=1 Tax=Cryobacterium glaciale TaxID=1259145 RepID=A0A4R8UYI6_9MICO|nr:hypothetical protein E3O06_07030 [Cryobacterium glaciale]